MGAVGEKAESLKHRAAELSEKIPAPVWMVVAVCFMAVSNAFTKKLCFSLSSLSIIFYRGGFELLILFLALGHKRFFQSFKTSCLKTHFLRGLFGLGFLFLMYTSLKHLNLSVYTTIAYLCPVLVVVLGRWVLKESFHKKVIFSIAICFLGVLIAINPHGSIEFRWMGIGVAAIIFEALVILLTKKASLRGESPLKIVLFYLLFVFCGGMFFVPTVESINIQEGLLLLGLSVAHLISFFCWTLAVEREEIRKLIPYEYLGLPLGIFSGVWVFGDVLSLHLLCGGAIVIIGLVVLNIKSETRRYIKGFSCKDTT